MRAPQPPQPLPSRNGPGLPRHEMVYVHKCQVRRVHAPSPEQCAVASHWVVSNRSLALIAARTIYVQFILRACMLLSTKGPIRGSRVGLEPAPVTLMGFCAAITPQAHCLEVSLSLWQTHGHSSHTEGRRPKSGTGFLGHSSRKLARKKKTASKFEAVFKGTILLNCRSLASLGMTTKQRSESPNYARAATASAG